MYHTNEPSSVIKHTHTPYVATRIAIQSCAAMVQVQYIGATPVTPFVVDAVTGFGLVFTDEGKFEATSMVAPSLLIGIYVDTILACVVFGQSLPRHNAIS